mmetsp:Transcript_23086/g.55982  ORF Transcript_23086/g.55982 Transcript_23086/m.55982 type:complete len:841 (-) Transcript_23086:1418-3940(-)
MGSQGQSIVDVSSPPAPASSTPSSTSSTPTMYKISEDVTERNSPDTLEIKDVTEVSMPISNSCVEVHVKFEGDYSSRSDRLTLEEHVEKIIKQKYKDGSVVGSRLGSIIVLGVIPTTVEQQSSKSNLWLKAYAEEIRNHLRPELFEHPHCGIPEVDIPLLASFEIFGYPGPSILLEITTKQPPSLAMRLFEQAAEYNMEKVMSTKEKKSSVLSSSSSSSSSKATSSSSDSESHESITWFYKSMSLQNTRIEDINPGGMLYQIVHLLKKRIDGDQKKSGTATQIILDYWAFEITPPLRESRSKMIESSRFFPTLEVKTRLATSRSSISREAKPTLATPAPPKKSPAAVSRKPKLRERKLKPEARLDTKIKMSTFLDNGTLPATIASNSPSPATSMSFSPSLLVSSSSLKQLRFAKQEQRALEAHVLEEKKNFLQLIVGDDDGGESVMMSGDDERLGGSSFLEIKGWLWKKNQSFGWVKRYVCLDSNLLEYYEKSGHDFPLGFVNSRSIIESKLEGPKSKSFTIKTVDHTFLLQALSADFAAEWVRTVKMIVEHNFKVSTGSLKASLLANMPLNQLASTAIQNTLTHSPSEQRHRNLRAQRPTKGNRTSSECLVSGERASGEDEDLDSYTRKESKRGNNTESLWTSLLERFATDRDAANDNFGRKLKMKISQCSNDQALELIFRVLLHSLLTRGRNSSKIKLNDSSRIVDAHNPPSTTKNTSEASSRYASSRNADVHSSFETFGSLSIQLRQKSHPALSPFSTLTTSHHSHHSHPLQPPAQHLRVLQPRLQVHNTHVPNSASSNHALCTKAKFRVQKTTRTFSHRLNQACSCEGNFALFLFV